MQRFIVTDTHTGMQSIAFRIRESSWVASIAAWKLGVPSVAITLGRTIHLHRAGREQFLQNKEWLRHELRHVEQFRVHGFLPFICQYLLESLRKGYFQNRFEREAREAERDDAYDPVTGNTRDGLGFFNPPFAWKSTPGSQNRNA
jgi:hypothetical protein